MKYYLCLIDPRPVVSVQGYQGREVLLLTLSLMRGPGVTLELGIRSCRTRRSFWFQITGENKLKRPVILWLADETCGVYYSQLD